MAIILELPLLSSTIIDLVSSAKDWIGKRKENSSDETEINWNKYENQKNQWNCDLWFFSELQFSPSFLGFPPFFFDAIGFQNILHPLYIQLWLYALLSLKKNRKKKTYFCLVKLNLKILLLRLTIWILIVRSYDNLSWRCILF